MPTRLCPICGIVPLRRREVNTCGSSDCVQTWRSLSPQQKVDAMEGVLVPKNEHIFSVEPSGRIARPNEKSSSKSTQTDNEFLEKIFGPDAPGVVKPEEEDK